MQGDLTLYALKAALGLGASQLPERVSGIAVELWRQDNGTEEIRVQQ